MGPRWFTKRYDTPQECAAALFHYRWLSTFARPLRLPSLVSVRKRHMHLERVNGRHAVPADLGALAGHLGDAHGAAWVATLHGARLDRVHPGGGGDVVVDFLTPRLAALNRRPELRSMIGTGGTEAIADLLREHAKGPVAFYKDTNPRNILVTPIGRPVTVDVDDLTLAPFGYDLAKLVVTLAMTYGRLSVNAIKGALDAYNASAARHATELGSTSLAHLLDFAEIHHAFTVSYLGRGGYQYPWTAVRPRSLQGSYE